MPQATRPCGPCAMAFPSSRPPRPVGSQHPFRLGLSTLGWPYPSDYRRAFASSHVLCPLGIGRLCSRLSQGFTVPPAGDADARGPLCPGGGLSCRGADSDRHILSTYLLVRADQPLWLFRLHEVCGCSPCYPSRLSSRPISRCGSQTSVLFGVLHTPPLPETHDADEERQTGSPRSL